MSDTENKNLKENTEETPEAEIVLEEQKNSNESYKPEASDLVTQDDAGDDPGQNTVSDDDEEATKDVYEPDEEAAQDVAQADEAQKSQSSTALKLKVFIASIIYKIYKTDRKRLIRNTVASAIVLLFVVLIFTDIIPILPNAYHRSYTGNTYTLGETQNCVYDKFDDGVLFVGGGMLYCFGADMKPDFKYEIHTGIPTVRTNSDKAIIRFKNSGEYVVVDKGEISNRSIEEKIISAYINSKGYYTIVTDAVAGHNACVTAYSPDGTNIYEWFTNYNVIDAAISSDASFMVAAVIEEGEKGINGKLIFFDLSKSTPIDEITMNDNLIFELYSTKNDKIIAVGDNSTDAYTFSANKIWQIDYRDRNFKTYDICDGETIAFVFDRYNSAMSESQIETYDFDGDKLGDYTSDKNVSYVSVNNGYCLLSLDSGTALLSRRCRLKEEKITDMNFDKAVLYENYNFGFVIHDGVSTVLSVKH